MASVGGGDGKELNLNLYPMLDIFSILIVFLLMNFSTEGQSVETKAQNLELPRSSVMLSLDEAATVSVTKNEIIVQGTVKIPISDGDVNASVLSQGAIMPAYEEFKKLRDSMQTLKNRDQSLSLSEKEINTLSMEADKKTQFKLLKRVMLTAQQAEFVSWKLAVDKEEI